MGFLRRLFGGGQASPADRALHLYIKCNRCGTGVHVRVDLNNDLSADYGDDEDDTEGYTLVKEVMDDRCFRLMQATVQFDGRRRETSRTIEGGTFISEAEYEELRAKRGASPGSTSG